MSTNNVNKMENEIINAFASRLMQLSQDVQNSTGSLHTKNDVLVLLERALDNSFVKTICEIVAENQIEVELQTDNCYYSLDMDTEAIGNMNFASYVTVDKDSAEFSLSYNNRIELDEVEFEVDDSELLEDFEIKLNEALEKTRN